MDVLVYADYAASAPISEAACRAMVEYIKICGNPSSAHAAGFAAREVIEDARKKVASLIGCERDEVYFTSGGTESCNLAVQGGFRYAVAHGGERVVTSDIEHSAVMSSVRYLGRHGASVRYVSAAERDEKNGEAAGSVSVHDLEAALRDGAGLVCLMHANSETGVLQPVRDAAALAHSAGAIFFCDAVASVGHVPISVSDIGADMLSVSGHKLGAPVGIGALYVRRGITISPMMLGGGQERGLRSGTEPAALIAAFGEACREVGTCTGESGRILGLRERIAQSLLEIEGAHRNGSAERTLPGVLNISFDGVGGEEIVNLCSLRGVCISAGSACNSGKSEPSRVLLSMGYSSERALGAVRISIGAGTYDADADAIVNAVRDSVKRIRES